MFYIFVFIVLWKVTLFSLNLTAFLSLLPATDIWYFLVLNTHIKSAAT